MEQYAPIFTLAIDLYSSFHSRLFTAKIVPGVVHYTLAGWSKTMGFLPRGNFAPGLQTIIQLTIYSFVIPLTMFN